MADPETDNEQLDLGIPATEATEQPVRLTQEDRVKGMQDALRLGRTASSLAGHNQAVVRAAERAETQGLGGEATRTEFIDTGASKPTKGVPNKDVDHVLTQKDKEQKKRGVRDEQGTISRNELSHRQKITGDEPSPAEQELAKKRREDLRKPEPPEEPDIYDLI